MEDSVSEIKFKGDRKYLQSASVFDELAGRLGRVRDVDFTFHRQTANQVRYSACAPANADDLVATWRDAERKIYVLDTRNPVTESEEYDEEKLVRLLSFTDEGVVVPVMRGEFSFLEAIVAAFKHLLLRREPDRKTKYVFARLKLSRIPKGPVIVRFARKIGGFHQAQVLQEGEALGQLFYGEWK